MKNKNKALRLASCLLIAVLLTTCAVSGTFAKYVTTANGSDSARVAKWGFQPTTITLTDLFKDAYDTTVNGATDVIAPGTTGEAKFGFTYGGASGIGAPEVAYTFVVSTEGSSCDDAIKNNANIKWSLDGVLAKADGKTDGSWDALLAAIQALDGNKTDDRYEPNTLPAAFNATGNNEHTVSWEWTFAGNDAADTLMGNADTLANVTIKITITATQVD